MEPEDEALASCVEQLSILLKHEDPSTAQKALKCFALLAGNAALHSPPPLSYTHTLSLSLSVLLYVSLSVMCWY
jgi:hypothetical protein